MPRLGLLAPVALALGLVLACGFAPVARASAGPKIVNGAAVSDIATHPYQVALWHPSRGNPSDGQFCGGVVLSATRIVTAAHCLADNSGVPGPPRGVNVLAGTADLRSGGTSVPAATLAVDDRYDAPTNDHDVGLIELSTPLWDGPDPTIGTSAIAPIPVANDTIFGAWLANADTTPITTTVSGWGYDEPVAPAGSPSDPNGFPPILQTMDVPLIAQSTCINDYSNPPNNTQIDGLTLFCAGNDSDTNNVANMDSCNGDSGGPLVIDPDQAAPRTDLVLAGLVDSGFGCAQFQLPGIYTRVSALTDFTGATDPHLTAPPTVSGTPQVGQTLTCSGGSWNGATTPVSYRFYNETASGPEAIGSFSSSPTYTPTAAGDVFCEVLASAGHTQRTADSASVTVGPSSPQPPPGVVDSTAPTTRVTSKKCTRTSCTVKIRVSDAAPSSGIDRVKVVMRWSKKVKCKSRQAGAAKTCTKRVRRTLKAKAGSNGVFTIVAKRLRPGTRYSLSITPVDKAGNKPQLSTITNVRTKSRHRRGLLN